MIAIDLDNPEMAPAKKHVKYVQYKKGTILLRPEEESQQMFFVIDGFLKAFSINARGEEAVVALFGKNDFFPLAWLIGQKRFKTTVQAISDCTIAQMPQEIFQQQLKSNVNFTYVVMQKVMEQFILYLSYVNNLSLKYGRERLAYRLLLMAAIFGEYKGDTVLLPHISQFDLAAMVNISREGISREMSRFDRMDILKYSSKGIEILDLKSLHKELGDDVKVMFYDTNAS